MPWRLIVFIVLFAVFLVFITFNLDNRCDISFGSETLTFKEVPVFITVFVSFIFGMLCALPLAFAMIKRKKKPKKESNISSPPPVLPSGNKEKLFNK